LITKKSFKLLFLLLILIITYIYLAVSCKKEKYKKIMEEDIIIEKDIIFFNEGKLKLHLDVYKPKINNRKKLKPILWIHGGGFEPQIDKEQDYIVNFCKYFAEKGYLCISIDYRTSEYPFANWEKTITNTLEDTFHAIEWIKKNKNKYSLDLNYLTVAGGSAGGIISMFASAKYANLKETPYLFANIILWGSPHYLQEPLSDNYPPTLMIHGKKDKIVPYKNSLFISEKLNDLGIYHELMTIENEGHTPVSHFNDIALRIEGFLKKVEKIKSVE